MPYDVVWNGKRERPVADVPGHRKAPTTDRRPRGKDRPVSESAADKMVMLRRLGHTVADIAVRMDIRPETVSRHTARRVQRPPK